MNTDFLTETPLFSIRVDPRSSAANFVRCFFNKLLDRKECAGKMPVDIGGQFVIQVICNGGHFVKKKLVLKKVTLRTLNDSTLDLVVGGTSNNCPTFVACPHSGDVESCASTCDHTVSIGSDCC